MGSTCFFCQLTYYSTLSRAARGQIKKLFLTYLEVINISVVDIQDVDGEVPFHACPPCANILQNISTQILQLEEEMKKIFAIISQNCGDGHGGVGKLGELKTEIISRYNSNVKHNYVKNVTSAAPPLANPFPHPRQIAPEPCFMIDPTGRIIYHAGNPPPHVINPTPPIVHTTDPKPSQIMIVPVDPETIKLEPDLKLETDLDPLKLETDPSEEAEVDLDDFMIHPDDNMDVDPSEDPLSTSAPSSRLGGRPVNSKNKPYPPGWRKFFRGVEVTRADHKSHPCGFQCGKCDFRHIFWKHMNDHILEKHQPALEAFEFKCPTCGVLFAMKKLLTSHITRKHTLHSCKHCDFTSKFPSHLTNHIATAHPELPDPLKCPTCGRVISSQVQCDKHVKRCRVGFETDDTKFPRPTSVETSRTTWTYLDVAMSKVDGKICCSQCDYTNPKKRNVTTHIRAVHKKYLPFRCPNFECSWPFANQTLLDEHFASSGHGPQACDVCGKVLNSKHSLRHHVKVAHEKSERFICTTCGKGFHLLSACTAHESTCLAANGGKARNLTKEEKAILAAARKSILEQDIISNPCKHCAKRIFGSSTSLSFHEGKCRLGSTVQDGEEMVKVGIRLIDDSVELSTVRVTEPHVIKLYKCWGCNKTYHHRAAALAHIRAERHGHSDAPPSESENT